MSMLRKIQGKNKKENEVEENKDNYNNKRWLERVRKEKYGKGETIWTEDEMTVTGIRGIKCEGVRIITKVREKWRHNEKVYPLKGWETQFPLSFTPKGKILRIT